MAPTRGQRMLRIGESTHCSQEFPHPPTWLSLLVGTSTQSRLPGSQTAFLDAPCYSRRLQGPAEGRPLLWVQFPPLSSGLYPSTIPMLDLLLLLTLCLILVPEPL